MKPKEIIKITRQIARPFRVTKGKDFRLKDVDPNDTLDFTKEEHKPAAKEALALGVAALADLQDKLYAQVAFSGRSRPRIERYSSDPLQAIHAWVAEYQKRHRKDSEG